MEKVMVETEPLSMRIEDIGFVNILKIDIEGAEYQAFLGLENNLKNKMIGSIVFELNKLRIGEEWYDFYEFLNKLRMIYGWEFYTLSVDGDLVLSDLKEFFTLDFVENVVMVLK
ncbi:FkbM family methyltransferase [Paenibacillus sp. AK121]|uniref:FkbM family methyltransferase n=1 Tax=Paenibacillus sp. AK121 TaxID=2849670 RepID=UPI00349F1C88